MEKTSTNYQNDKNPSWVNLEIILQDTNTHTFRVNDVCQLTLVELYHNDTNFEYFSSSVNQMGSNLLSGELQKNPEIASSEAMLQSVEVTLYKQALNTEIQKLEDSFELNPNFEQEFINNLFWSGSYGGQDLTPEAIQEFNLSAPVGPTPEQIQNDPSCKWYEALLQHAQQAAQSQQSLQSQNREQTQTVQQSNLTQNVTPTSKPSGSIAIIATNFGDIQILLLDNIAPKTVTNFEKLANSGFYNGTIFHRIVPGFVIQGGDPNTKSGPRDTWGLGNAGYTIPPEFSDMNFTKYMVGMARGADVNSGSSQFFITLGDASFLNGKYTLFGQVVSGQDVVDKIASLPINSDNQPVNASDALITKITIQS